MGNTNAATFPFNALPMNEDGNPYVTMQHTRPSKPEDVVGSMDGKILVPKEVQSRSRALQLTATAPAAFTHDAIRAETFRSGAFMFHPPKCTRLPRLLRYGKNGKVKSEMQTCSFMALHLGRKNSSFHGLY